MSKRVKKQTMPIKARKNKAPKSVSISKQKGPITALIKYDDLIQDPRKLEALKILALSGYNRDRSVRGAINKAAKEAKVNRMTIYAWLNQADFVQALEEIKGEVLFSAMQGLWTLAEDCDFSACAFLAERLDPTMSLEHKRQTNRMELLKAQQEGPPQIELAPPTIIIEQSTISPEYDRNKLS